MARLTQLLVLVMIGGFFNLAGCTAFGISKQDAQDIAKITAESFGTAVTSNIASELKKGVDIGALKERAAEVGKASADEALGAFEKSMREKAKEKQDQGESSTTYLVIAYLAAEARKAFRDYKAEKAAKAEGPPVKT